MMKGVMLVGLSMGLLPLHMSNWQKLSVSVNLFKNSVTTDITFSEYKCKLTELVVKINQPNLPILIRHFLFRQLNPNHAGPVSSLPHASYPHLDNSTIISVHSSALATFYAPSDPSGIGGMRCEYIRAGFSGGKGPPRCDGLLFT